MDTGIINKDSFIQLKKTIPYDYDDNDSKITIKRALF